MCDRGRRAAERGTLRLLINAGASLAFWYQNPHCWDALLVTFDHWSLSTLHTNAAALTRTMTATIAAVTEVGFVSRFQRAAALAAVMADLIQFTTNLPPAPFIRLLSAEMKHWR